MSYIPKVSFYVKRKLVAMYQTSVIPRVGENVVIPHDTKPSDSYLVSQVSYKWVDGSGYAPVVIVLMEKA